VGDGKRGGLRKTARHCYAVARKIGGDLSAVDLEYEAQKVQLLLYFRQH